MFSIAPAHHSMFDISQTNRTPIDCMRHAFNRKSHSWTLESDARLLEAVEIYGTDNWNLGSDVSPKFHGGTSVAYTISA